MSDHVVELNGEWTIAFAAELKQALSAHIAAGLSVFDASAVNEMDSAGLQLLLAAQRSLARQGRELVLRQPSPAVALVLQSYGMDEELRGASELRTASEVTA